MFDRILCIIIGFSLFLTGAIPSLTYPNNNRANLIAIDRTIKHLFTKERITLS